MHLQLLRRMREHLRQRSQSALHAHKVLDERLFTRTRHLRAALAHPNLSALVVVALHAAGIAAGAATGAALAPGAAAVTAASSPARLRILRWRQRRPVRIARQHRRWRIRSHTVRRPLRRRRRRTRPTWRRGVRRQARSAHRRRHWRTDWSGVRSRAC